MSDRSRPLAGVALLFVACGGPGPAQQDPPAEPAVQGEPGASDRSVEAVPKDSSAVTPPIAPPPLTAPPVPPAPVPAAEPPAAVAMTPAAGPPLPPQIVTATGANGPLTLHLAAIREGDIALDRLVDGSLAVRGGVALAIAAPGEGAPRREPAWLRDLPRDPYQVSEPVAFGGRWPEAAFFTLLEEGSRAGDDHPMLRWQVDRWTHIEAKEAAPGLASYHIAYAGGPGGAVLGLRSHALATFSDDDYSPAEIRKFKAALRSVTPTVDRLDSAEPTAWSALPPGPVGTGLLSFADGTLVVVRGGPKLQRWTPGAGAWKSLPDVGYKAGDDDSATLVGRDPARLYLFSCADGSTSRLHRLTGAAWEPIATPDGKCVRSLAEDAEGAVWLVTAGGLYRHVAPGPPPGGVPSIAWESISLPAVQLPAQPMAWRFDDVGNAWHPYPEVAAQQQPLTAARVLALGPGDVWFIADAGKDRFHGGVRQVVLTTRKIDAPIGLPDGGRIELEVHAQEPRTLDDACVSPLLELGVVSDAPASARPAALAEPAVAGLLEGLTVASVEVGPRHDVAVLWLVGPDDDHHGALARLTPLLAPLRPHFPALRIICMAPLIEAVLP